MFDFGYSELFLIAAAILIFIGPKELPLLLRSIFDFVSKIKVYSSELRTGIQSIANDIEIEKISEKIIPANKKNKKDNKDKKNK
jgi:sec-independent protein translocase protein TatB